MENLISSKIQYIFPKAANIGILSIEQAQTLADWKIEATRASHCSAQTFAGMMMFNHHTAGFKTRPVSSGVKDGRFQVHLEGTNPMDAIFDVLQNAVSNDVLTVDAANDAYFTLEKQISSLSEASTPDAKAARTSAKRRAGNRSSATPKAHK